MAVTGWAGAQSDRRSVHAAAVEGSRPDHDSRGAAQRHLLALRAAAGARRQRHAGADHKAYALDMKANGFGVVEMPFHASAVHVDPVTDTMYLVLDDINEPDDPRCRFRRRHRPASPQAT